MEANDEIVGAVLSGDRSRLPNRLAVLLDYAAKLSMRPASVTSDDVDRLREAGLSDESVLHAAEIIAYFAFVNRLATGLGVQLEDG